MKQIVRTINARARQCLTLVSSAPDGQLCMGTPSQRGHRWLRFSYCGATATIRECAARLLGGAWRVTPAAAAAVAFHDHEHVQLPDEHAHLPDEHVQLPDGHVHLPDEHVHDPLLLL